MHVPFLGKTPPKPGTAPPPALWPAEGADAGTGGRVVTATDELGLLYVIHHVPGRPGGPRAFCALATYGGRSLLAASGTFLLVKGEDPNMRAALAAKAGLAVKAPGAYGESPAAPDSFLPGAPASAALRAMREAAAHWEGEARACWETFVAGAGPATLLAASAGASPTILSAEDARIGEAAVEATLARRPALLGLVAHGGALLATPDALGTLDSALNPEASTRAAAAACARFAGMLLAAGAGAFPQASPDPACEEAVSARAESIARFLKVCAARPVAPDLGLRAMLIAEAIPRDWWPEDPDALGDLVALASAAAALAATSGWRLSVEGMLAPVKGDWTRAADQLKAAVGSAPLNAPATWSSDVRDMAVALAREAVRPSVAHAAFARGADLASGDDDATTEGMAWDLLFRGKGLAAVAEASHDWHRRGPAITETVNGLGAYREMRWRRPFADFTASNGRQVVPLLSSEAIALEGRAMCHCVAGYSHGASLGRYAIASVRDDTGEGSSTVQLSPEGAAIQHRGRHNGNPCAEDVAAVAELVAALRRDRPDIQRLGLVARAKALPAQVRKALVDLTAPAWVGRYAYDPRDPARVRTACLLWDRYLPRPARGGPAALIAGRYPEAAALLAQRGVPPIDIPRDRVLRAAPGLAWRGFMLIPADIRILVSAVGGFGAAVSVVAFLAAPSQEKLREQEIYRTSLERMLADDGVPRWGHKPGAPATAQGTAPPAAGASRAVVPARQPAERLDQRPAPVSPAIRERLTIMDGSEGRTLRPGVPADRRLQDDWIRMMSDDGTPRWGYRRRGAAFDVPSVPGPAPAQDAAPAQAR